MTRLAVVVEGHVAGIGLTVTRAGRPRFGDRVTRPETPETVVAR